MIRKRILLTHLILEFVTLTIGIAIGLAISYGERPVPDSIRTLAEKVNMDVYCSRGPFAVLLPKRRDSNSGYTFVSHNDIMLSVTPSNLFGPQVARNALLMFGANEHSQVTCIYSPSSGTALRELHLLKRDFGILDLNLDGQYDLRCWFQSKKVEAWYKGKWTDVEAVGGSRYVRKLSDGGRSICFDRNTGNWVLATGR